MLVEPPALSVQGRPDQVLAEAASAAKALKGVIDSKPDPVRLGGKTYLEFEDWQTVARFYGLTAKVLHTEAVTIQEADASGTLKVYARGYEAEAVALVVSTGQEISRAESMCLTDEPKWAGKPLFQLRSMAQTRACAKVLRNVLAWVVVLAGYGATPAEELPSTGRASRITEAQRRRLWKLADKQGWKKEQLAELLVRLVGLADTTAIGRDQYDEVCAAIEAGPDAPLAPAAASRDPF
jgi:hypothetical protein